MQIKFWMQLNAVKQFPQSLSQIEIKMTTRDDLVRPFRQDQEIS